MTTESKRYAELLDGLAADGRLAAPWRPSFDAVPRNWFVPEVVWRRQRGRYVQLDQLRDPLDWWDVAHSDRQVVTQVDDGRPDGPGEATSWVAAPSVVAGLLRDLGAVPGDQVLEVGTGTGWTAALLAHRLGGGAVTSIEVDLTVVGWARQALLRCEAVPEVLWHDGERAWGRNAPYDRIVSGCAVRRVPEAWLRQARVGAVIVAPLWMPFGPVPWVRLTVGEGRTATGRFTGSGPMVLVRRQRGLSADVPVRGEPRPGRTRVEVASLRRPGFTVFAGARAPGLRLRQVRVAGEVEAWVYDGLGSAATASVGGVVQSYGPADLWHQVEEIWQEWRALGQPRLLDFGVTVTPRKQYLWLRDPTRPVDAAYPRTG